MFTSPQNPYTPQDQLRLISSCPLCHTHYNPWQTRILEERDDAHLIYLQCRKCGSAVVAVVLTGWFGVSSIGVVTDLTSEDVLRFKQSAPISADDVLDVHELLSYTGNPVAVHA